MGFLDELSRKIAEGVDRARFEAEKFQRVTAIQGEISHLRRQLDAKRLECGDRAIELLKAGAIQSPTLAALLREIEALQARLTLKEEELRHVQGLAFTEPTSAPRTQHVPVSVEPPRSLPPTPPPPQPVAGGKTCASCGFQMPQTAVFCPNCGLRAG
ncbi:MAG: zinc ribbon domain-containing protein [Roseiflexus sp.]|nr:zinc ribbon domain-containing protein [Roseiflexus sp.]MCS7287754.1 zinc ribbon domain-containing protein [Roseiflexus sp.]MDW8147570.1 zinc ribbon domain-containing protein [Roseiflexaceae bacterium]MDW8233175.1 zinc ribbon domain-containing protein [Roseiflexaceae bacterium]